MKLGAFESQRLAIVGRLLVADAKLSKVLSSLGYSFSKQANGDSSCTLAINVHIEEHFAGNLFQIIVCSKCAGGKGHETSSKTAYLCHL